MHFNQLIAAIFGCYVLCNSIVASSDSVADPARAGGGEVELPPLIFPTDKSKNNIVPINKTAIKILMLNEDLNSTNKSKQPGDNTLKPIEVDDLQETDKQIGRENYDRKGVSTTSKTFTKDISKYDDFKDQVEEIQEEEDETHNIIELEERYHRPKSDFIRRETVMSDIHHGLEHNHIAWIAISLVIFLAFAIYMTLVFWRNRLERRYGHRHRLVAEESFHELAL